jgi:hypothetical protein
MESREYFEKVMQDYNQNKICQSLSVRNHVLTTHQWRELLSKPLPEGTKCLEPKEYRAPKPTETQVLSMVRLMTTATTWDEFRAIPKDEKLKTIKQLLQNGASIRQMEKLTGIGRGIIQNL